MCGIAGYVGSGCAVRRAVASLRRLEYRGYDSAGVAGASGGALRIDRCLGPVAGLGPAIDGRSVCDGAAISHTRWATHGRPSVENAHPHVDCSGTIAVVHNGIIENHATLRARLKGCGHTFRSQTDTEVIPHLIERFLPAAPTPDQFVDAVRSATRKLQGSYAIAAVCARTPGMLVAVRQDSPLLVGLGADGILVASDVPALIGCADRYLVLENGDCAVVDARGVRITGPNGEARFRPERTVPLSAADAEKGGYAHFMLKEIHEEPSAVRESLRGRLTWPDGGDLDGIQPEVIALLRTSDIHFVGCGTAYHAGLLGKRMFEQILRRRSDATVASEFRYDDPLVGSGSLVVLISQSGETADTLEAGREARRKGAKTLAIVNCVGSTMERESDFVLPTRAGPEIGVASTKAYAAQVAVLAALAAAAGGNELAAHLALLPDTVRAALDVECRVARLARQVAGSNCFFFLGRGYDAAVAAEAALKLKEISYIHAEAYHAGEMKHGPLALVEPGVAVVGIATQARTHAKLCSNLMEAKARDAHTIAFVRGGLPAPEAADRTIPLPSTDEALMPVVSMVALQLLAYHVARERGCSIDQPRNLAKSVTVE